MAVHLSPSRGAGTSLRPLFTFLSFLGSGTEKKKKAGIYSCLTNSAWLIRSILSLRDCVLLPSPALPHAPNSCAALLLRNQAIGEDRDGPAPATCPQSGRSKSSSQNLAHSASHPSLAPCRRLISGMSMTLVSTSLRLHPRLRVRYRTARPARLALALDALAALGALLAVHVDERLHRI